MSPEDWKTAEGFLLSVLDSDANRVIWANYEQTGVIDPEFRKEIGTALKQSNGTSARAWRAMSEGLRALGRNRPLEDATLRTDDTGSTSAPH